MKSEGVKFVYAAKRLLINSKTFSTILIVAGSMPTSLRIDSMKDIIDSNISVLLS